MKEEQTGLTWHHQLANALFGAGFIVRLVQAAFWLVRLWTYQRQHGKPICLPCIIAFIADHTSMADASTILNGYRIQHMPLILHWTDDYGEPIIKCSILVNGNQFDYADAILYQHGVTLVSPAGSKRGQNVGQPRDYGDRQPQRKQAHRPKLGKTYS